MRQNERQKWGQTQVHNQLELHFPEESIKIKGNAVDISPGGIGLLTSKRIPVGQQVVIRIGFLNVHESIQFETVSGTVKWCRTQGFGFAAGIEFKELNPNHHPRLFNFLQQDGPLKESIRGFNVSDDLK